MPPRRQSQLLLNAAKHEAPLRAYVHNTARRAVEADGLSEIAEQRQVVVAFSMVLGLETALLSGASGVPTVQALASPRTSARPRPGPRPCSRRTTSRGFRMPSRRDLAAISP